MNIRELNEELRSVLNEGRIAFSDFLTGLKRALNRKELTWNFQAIDNIHTDYNIVLGRRSDGNTVFGFAVIDCSSINKSISMEELKKTEIRVELNADTEDDDGIFYQKTSYMTKPLDKILTEDEIEKVYEML